MSLSAADRHQSVLPPAEEYLEIGFNYRMTDVQAAIGIVQLGRLGALVARRRQIADIYRSAFADIPGLRCVVDPNYGTSNFQSFWVEVTEYFPIDRESLLEHLATRDISARRGIMAAHQQPAYRQYADLDLPVTNRLTARTVILPVYHQMTEDEQRRVVAAIVSASRLAAA